MTNSESVKIRWCPRKSVKRVSRRIERRGIPRKLKRTVIVDKRVAMPRVVIDYVQEALSVRQCGKCEERSGSQISAACS